MKKIALYPGTFDPITLGHVDIIQRGLKLFDKIVIAISESAVKSPLFSLKERLDINQSVFSNNENVAIIPFSGLLVDLMAKEQINIIIRGIRSNADIEHEFHLAGMNQLMKPDVETVFLKADPRYVNISSSIVREIAKMNSKNSLGDLSLFAPKAVVDAFSKNDITNN